MSNPSDSPVINTEALSLLDHQVAYQTTTTKVLTVKRFWLLWLPVSCVLASLFLFAWSFVVEIDAYQLYYKAANLDFWGLMSGMFSITTGLLSVWLVWVLAIFIFTEAYFIRRIFQIRKSALFPKKRSLLRLIVAQLYVCVSAAVSFLIIGMLLLSLFLITAFLDNKFRAVSTSEYISDQEVIIQNIVDAPGLLQIYTGQNELALKLGASNKKNIYNMVVLPSLSQSSYFKQNDKASYYFPKNNSVLLSSYDVSQLEKVLAELVHNRFKYSTYPQIRESFSKKQKPTVTYLEDDSYADVLRKRNDQINQAEIIKLRQGVYEANQYVLECSAFEISNQKLIEEDSLDYQKNCVDRVYYDNCAEFKADLDASIVIANTNKETCAWNRTNLLEWQKSLDEFIQFVKELDGDILEQAKYDGSVGIYLFGTQDIFMRTVSGTPIYEYLHILFHEYLHYYSAINVIEIPQFINEGITDYLTYVAFDFQPYEFSQSDVTGYYRENQIILALLEKIPESELLDFYFGKGPQTFEDLFVKYFPDIAYDEFLLKGEAVFNDTFGVGDINVEIGFFDTPDNHPLVQDLRRFLGLDEWKDFYYTD